MIRRTAHWTGSTNRCSGRGYCHAPPCGTAPAPQHNTYCNNPCRGVFDSSPAVANRPPHSCRRCTPEISACPWAAPLPAPRFASTRRTSWRGPWNGSSRRGRMCRLRMQVAPCPDRVEAVDDTANFGLLAVTDVVNIPAASGPTSRRETSLEPTSSRQPPATRSRMSPPACGHPTAAPSPSPPTDE
jgi:hypothetical protein